MNNNNIIAIHGKVIEQKGERKIRNGRIKF